MNTYQTELLKLQAQIEAHLTAQEAIIGKARKGTMGLTLEEDKTPEYKQAVKQHATLWANYRKVNGAISKQRKHVWYELQNGKWVSIYKYKD